MFEQTDIAPASEVENAPHTAPLTTTAGPPPKSIIRNYFEQGLMTVVIAIFLMTFVAQAVQVPTGSMQNNIHIGDHLFVNKFVFGQPTPMLKWLLPARGIRRGDIIVFKFPEDPEINYVKRVVGLPGETVAIRGTRVFVNDVELAEQRVTVRLLGTENSSNPEVSIEPPRDGAHYRVYYDDRDRSVGELDLSAGPTLVGEEGVLVPADHYFALGDNRDNSLDSRDWGFVPRSSIIGRALYVYFSFNPRDPGYKGSDNRILRFFGQTDWRRTGTAIK